MKMTYSLKNCERLISENPDDVIGYNFRKEMGLLLYKNIHKDFNKLHKFLFNKRCKFSKHNKTNFYKCKSLALKRIKGKDINSYSIGSNLNNRTKYIKSFFNKHCERIDNVQKDNCNYTILHTNGKLVPIGMKKCHKLWNSDNLNDILHFEWLWYNLNPYGRGGAFIGNFMSLVKLKQNGYINKKFKHWDLYALCYDKTKYIKIRRQYLTTL